MILPKLASAALAVALVAAPAIAQQGSPHSIAIEKIGTYASGLFAAGAAEIAAYDARSARLFVTNAAVGTIDVLDLRDPAAPVKLVTIDVTPYGAGANSVAVHRGVVAAAVEAVVRTDPGTVVFFDIDGNYLNHLTVGALPDMLVFSPNGRHLVVANEGEPNDDYTIDPEGSISIIDMRREVRALTQTDVRTADFRAYNGVPLDARIRIYGPGASVAQDLEPEYIAISRDNRSAYVSLQENNAVAVVDLQRAEVTRLLALGLKDHAAPGAGLDASDRDGAINIRNWPVKGLYQPDAIAVLRHDDRDYLISANEGDTRDYDGYSEERRVAALSLDPAVFPDAAALRANAALGRLTASTASGDADGDGLFEEIHVPGARSFSVWRTDGTRVFDSGEEFERITAAQYPADFNSTNDANGSFDTRSDNKGPEPEGLALGKIRGRDYAFIGLERIGGVMVYDLTELDRPRFVQYLNTRDFAGNAAAGTAGDLGPEGLLFIDADDSPVKVPLLVVTNEVSGTTAIYRVDRVRR